jgi:hypothetical protein
MASRNKDERANVNALIKAIQKNTHRVYVHIDRDSGTLRHTSSGYDFLLASCGRVVFVEAKQGSGKLSDWQEFTRSLVNVAACSYRVVRFWEEGKFFTVDDGNMVETEKAKITDFIEIQ